MYIYMYILTCTSGFHLVLWIPAPSHTRNRHIHTLKEFRDTTIIRRSYCGNLSK